eukprot:tig00021234_g19413.t1
MAAALAPTLNDLWKALSQGSERVSPATLIQFFKDVQNEIWDQRDVPSSGWTFDDLKTYISDSDAFLDKEQDLSRPISEYFISSSHNTYLQGNQLTSESSAEEYKKCLLRGCRCVEIDVWDGKPEEGSQPIVTHGGTRCGRIPFREVVQAIAETGHAASEMPVIVNVENHCTPGQQALMARALQEAFGDRIALPDAGAAVLPSPQALRGKFLIRTPVKSSTDPSLARLVFFTNTKYEPAGGKKYKTHSSVSLSSRKIDGYVKAKRRLLSWLPVQKAPEGKEAASTAAGRAKMVHFSRHVVCRAYPSGDKVLSGNYDPILPWSCGFQLVALNWQNENTENELNRGKFLQNGNCGYVLKPRFMREEGPELAPPPESRRTVEVLIQQAGMLERPHMAEADDLYVVLRVLGLDSDGQAFKTRAVDNNAVDPVWGESFSCTVACAELALLRFELWDSDVGKDDFVGSCVLPLECIRPGYRTVTIRDRKGRKLYRLYVGFRVAYPMGVRPRSPERRVIRAANPGSGNSPSLSLEPPSPNAEAGGAATGRRPFRSRFRGPAGGGSGGDLGPTGARSRPPPSPLRSPGTIPGPASSPTSPPSRAPRPSSPPPPAAAAEGRGGAQGGAAGAGGAGGGLGGGLRGGGRGPPRPRRLPRGRERDAEAADPGIAAGLSGDEAPPRRRSPGVARAPPSPAPRPRAAAAPSPHLGPESDAFEIFQHNSARHSVCTEPRLARPPPNSV